MRGFTVCSASRSEQVKLTIRFDRENLVSPGERKLIETLPRPPLEANVSFNGLYIVEWLHDSPCEPRTGWELHLKMEHLRPGWSRYVRCETKNDVFRAIGNATVVRGVAPILHIECHGDDAGLGNGASDEKILWDELRPLLQALNLASECNLLVFIAACEGFAGIKALTEGPRAAAAVLIGPASPLDTDQLAAATDTFYSEFARGNAHLQTVVDAMNAQCGVHFEPELMALLAFEATVERMVVDARDERRFERMERMRARLSDAGKSTEAMSHFDEITAKAAQHTWDILFMLDRYPSNASRFGVDIVGLARRIAAFRGRAW
jgi:hypothetical protein